MASRPTGTPQFWATDPGSRILTPTTGKQADGFAAEERPPAEYVNWLHNRIGDWMDYFDGHTVKLGAAAFNGWGSNTTHADHQNGTWESSSAHDVLVNYTIPSETGRILDTITLYIKEPNLAGEEVLSTIWRMDPTLGTASQTQISGTKTSGLTATFATQTWTSADADIPLTLSDTYVYWVYVDLQQTSAPSESKLYGIELGYN